MIFSSPGYRPKIKYSAVNNKKTATSELQLSFENAHGQW
jgi:hypothetical protein